MLLVCSYPGKGRHPDSIPLQLVAPPSTKYEAYYCEDSPAERKTICTVSGTWNAKAQLFRSELEVRTSTCAIHWRIGTCLLCR